MKTTKILGILGAVAATLIMASPVKAVYPPGLASNAKLTLSNPSIVGGTTAKINWTQTDATNAIKAIKIQFCTRASTLTDEVTAGCTVPTGFSSTGVTLTATEIIEAFGSWTATVNVNGTVTLINAGGATVGPASPSITLTGITMTPSTLADSGCKLSNNGTNDTAATCYARFTTYYDTNMTETTDNGTDKRIEYSTMTMTFTNPVTVSARVDPTFTFVVNPVAASTNTGAGVTTSVASTYNTLPFGNLQAGVAKYAAHMLTVTTNARGGYTVNMRMTTQLTGIYAANNIDGFSTAIAANWGSPALWAHPTGAVNDNSGYFGANISDNDDVTGWTTAAAPSGKFAGIFPATDYPVVIEPGTDSGSNYYVTYAIEAGNLQPADAYTGALVYNALPTY